MRRISILLLVFCTCFVLSAWAQAPPIITIDVSGAGTSTGQGTFAFSINDPGAITGWYVDANGVYHGFLCSPYGIITTFDDPDAGTVSPEGTVAYMISPQGNTIVGFYEDVSQVNHGFLRAPDGTFIAINAPGAGTGAGTGNYVGTEGTFAGSINPTGWISGWYEDASYVYHAFLRAPNDMITEFNVKGAGTGAGQGTVVAFNTGTNAAGTTTGQYFDPNSASHGYVRAPDGVITVFNVLGAGTGAGQGTEPSGINSEGAVTGYYVDTNGVGHGFLRAPDGSITKFDFPGAGTGSGQGTFGTMINAAGWIVGDYVDANGVTHGLLRAPDGALLPFDAPGAGNQSGQGTTPIFINSAGAITGYYADGSGVYHGFLRLPF